MEKIFQQISTKVAIWTGSARAFIWSCFIVLIWALSGPWFKFSDTWQLIINTGTTVATFLMVFLIQNTQNRDAKAIHIKLDELLKAEKGARNSIVSAEELSEKELDHLLAEYHEIHEKYSRAISKKGGKISYTKVIEK
ncbi:MAG: low affinity iron permease family protein [Candidatus Microgenomates bacterium]